MLRSSWFVRAAERKRAAILVVLTFEGVIIGQKGYGFDQKGGKCGQQGVVYKLSRFGGAGSPSCSQKGGLLSPLVRRGPVSPSIVPPP